MVPMGGWQATREELGRIETTVVGTFSTFLGGVEFGEIFGAQAGWDCEGAPTGL